MTKFLQKTFALITVAIIIISGGAVAQTTLLTESFDGTTFPPTGWKNQKIGGPTLPGNYNRVTAGTNPTNTPHSGAGETRFNSYNYLAGTVADLVTPAIDFSTEGIYTVSFWMYRENSASAAVDKIEVYVNTIQNSAGGTYIGTINRNRSQSPAESANGWYQYIFTIPTGYTSTSNYIAFKATSGFGGNMYIDDVSVERNTAVTPGCVASFAPISGTTSVCRNMSLSWTSVLYATSYKLTMGTNAPDYNNLYNNVDIGNVFTYSPTLLSASTTYNWKLVPTNVYGDATGCTFKNFTTGSSICYCIPTYAESSCLSEDYIDDFSTTGGETNVTNNSSGCSVDVINNFTYFSTQTVTAAQGDTFNVSMQPGPDFPEGFGIWADWNQDGDFDDADEFVFASPTAEVTVVNGTVTVPITALTGTTRFRIRCQFNFPPTSGQSCTYFENGETEDYNITVTACTPSTFYADIDGDTYGDISSTTSACVAPIGYTTNNTDCDDTNTSVNPAATEVCNGIDDDCDVLIDEEIIDATVTAGGPTTFCQPGSVTLSSVSGYSGYQWKKNGVSISGATSSSYIANTTANYSVVITSGSCTATSANTLVTSVKKPKATVSAPNGLDLCVVSTVLLRANNGTGISYQWYRDGSAISGATLRDYSTTLTGVYFVRVTNSTGCFKNSPTVTVVKPCKVEKDEECEIVMYPNPSTGIFTLLLQTGNKNKSYAEIHVTNMLGEIVMKYIVPVQSGEVTETLTLPENIPSGMYLVKIKADGEEFVKRLVISK